MSILIIFYCWSESKRTYIKDVILSKPYLSSSKKKIAAVIKLFAMNTNNKIKPLNW